VYPALASFFADPGRTTARGAVYLAIQPPLLSHSQPKPLKLEVICTRAHVRWATASEVRAWLIEHGYLQVHMRDGRGVPIVTLAWALGEDRPEAKHG
jgi:hypothetical protein